MQALVPEACSGEGIRKRQEVWRGLRLASWLPKDGQEPAAFSSPERQTAALRAGPRKAAQITTGITNPPQRFV